MRYHGEHRDELTGCAAHVRQLEPNCCRPTVLRQPDLGVVDLAGDHLWRREHLAAHHRGRGEQEHGDPTGGKARWAIRQGLSRNRNEAHSSATLLLFPQLAWRTHQDVEGGAFAGSGSLTNTTVRPVRSRPAWRIALTGRRNYEVGSSAALYGHVPAAALCSAAAP
jgi:hypothetical protein